jgi:hypothetical protein
MILFDSLDVESTFKNFIIFFSSYKIPFTHSDDEDALREIKFKWYDHSCNLIYCEVAINLVYVPDKLKLGLHIVKGKGDKDLFLKEKRKLENDLFVNI